MKCFSLFWEQRGGSEVRNLDVSFSSRLVGLRFFDIRMDCNENFVYQVYNKQSGCPLPPTTFGPSSYSSFPHHFSFYCFPFLKFLLGTILSWIGNSLGFECTFSCSICTSCSDYVLDESLLNLSFPVISECLIAFSLFITIN